MPLFITLSANPKILTLGKRKNHFPTPMFDIEGVDLSDCILLIPQTRHIPDGNPFSGAGGHF
jgi:hypothetical protein